MSGSPVRRRLIRDGFEVVVFEFNATCVIDVLWRRDDDEDSWEARSAFFSTLPAAVAAAHLVFDAEVRA